MLPITNNCKWSQKSKFLMSCSVPYTLYWSQKFLCDMRSRDNCCSFIKEISAFTRTFAISTWFIMKTAKKCYIIWPTTKRTSPEACGSRAYKHIFVKQMAVDILFTECHEPQAATNESWYKVRANDKIVICFDECERYPNQWKMERVFTFLSGFNSQTISQIPLNYNFYYYCCNAELPNPTTDYC